MGWGKGSLSLEVCMNEFGCWVALGLCVHILVFLFACVRLMYLATCVHLCNFH